MFPRRAMEKTSTTTTVLVGLLVQERKSERENRKERTQNKTRAAQQRIIRILLYSVVVAAVRLPRTDDSLALVIFPCLLVQQNEASKPFISLYSYTHGRGREAGVRSGRMEWMRHSHHI
jgi:hypothetical protein